MGRRFLRKSSDKVMGGVCSGLAEYVGTDVTLVRLITLFGIIASGIVPGLLLYFICTIIVPLDYRAGGGYNAGNPDQGGYSSGYDQNYNSGSYGPPSNNTRYVVGIVLVVIGVFFFARMFFGWLDWRYVFAGLLILGGLSMIFRNNRRDG